MDRAYSPAPYKKLYLYNWMTHNCTNSYCPTVEKMIKEDPNLENKLNPEYEEDDPWGSVYGTVGGVTPP